MSEINARIQQMINDDPLGKEAVSLLPYLVIFQGAFDGNALVAVLWGEIETAPSQLLKILKTWGLVEQPDRDHYRLKPEIEALYPSQPHLSERLFDYYNTRYQYAKSNRYDKIARDWSALSSTLLWGLRNKPNAALDLTLCLHPYMAEHVPLEEWRTIIDQAVQSSPQGERLYQACALKARGDIAFVQNELLAARVHYEQALSIYEQVPPSAERWSWADQVEFAFYVDTLAIDPQPSDPPHPQAHYFGISSLRDAFPLFAIFDLLRILIVFNDQSAIAIRSDQLQAIVAQAARAARHSGQISFRWLCALGAWAGQHNNLLTARFFYGHALEASENMPEEQIRVLWSWQQVEKAIGDSDAGRMLQELALYTLNAALDDFHDEITEAGNRSAEWRQRRYEHYAMLREMLTDKDGK